MNSISVPRTEQELRALIDNSVEESLTLEYKDGAALASDSKKKDEITKDVSALANSAGGVLIYGIGEGTGSSHQHLPQRFSPVDRSLFSKEWLEQVIQRIQPRIHEIEIISVSLSTGASDVAYVVVVPKSSTAHQAVDKRYYRRYNFMAVPMEDHEIRDVMNRVAVPVVDLRAELECDMHDPRQDYVGGSFLGAKPSPVMWMRLVAMNRGRVIATYVEGNIQILEKFIESGDGENGRVTFDNHIEQPTGAGGQFGPHLGNPQWMPILPGGERELKCIELKMLAFREWRNWSLPWFIQADTAPPATGHLSAEHIRIKMSDSFEAFLKKAREAKAT